MIKIQKNSIKVEKERPFFTASTPSHRGHHGSRDINFFPVSREVSTDSRCTVGSCSVSLLPLSFASSLCPGVACPALCHRLIDIMPFFTNLSCCLLCSPSLDDYGFEELIDLSCKIASFHKPFTLYFRLYPA